MSGPFEFRIVTAPIPDVKDQLFPELEALVTKVEEELGLYHKKKKTKRKSNAKNLKKYWQKFI